MPSNSRYKCCFGCENDGPLHRFPKPGAHIDKFVLWKHVLDDGVQQKGDTYIYNQIRLCNKHFEKCYCSPSNRLTANAVPTLCLNVLSQQHVGGSVMAVEPSTPEKCSSSLEQSHSVQDQPSGTHLHVFPNPKKDWDRFNTWVLTIGGDIVNLSNDFIYKYRRVCHAHFEEKYHCHSTRLSNAAVPTLNLPGLLCIPQYSMMVQPLREGQNLPENETCQVRGGLHLFESMPSTSKGIKQKTETHKNPSEDINIEPVAEEMNNEPENDYEPMSDIDNESVSETDFDNDETNFEDAEQNDENHTIDEIDALFLSYAKTFKQLSNRLQTMLKLDMAKLFSRYEMKEQINAVKFMQNPIKRPADETQSQPLLPKIKKKSTLPLNSVSAKTSQSTDQNPFPKIVSPTVLQIVGDEISLQAKRNKSVPMQDIIPDQTFYILRDHLEDNVRAVATDIVASTSDDIASTTDTEPSLKNVEQTAASDGVNFEGACFIDYDFTTLTKSRDVTS